MAAYLTADIIDAYIGEGVRREMTDDDDAILNQLISDASAVVDSAAQNAGYAVPFSGSAGTQHAVVRHATLGAFVTALYARRGIEVPEGLKLYINILAALRIGEMPIPGLEPTAQDAVGGVGFSDSDRESTSLDAKPRVFGRMRGVF